MGNHSSNHTCLTLTTTNISCLQEHSYTTQRFTDEISQSSAKSPCGAGAILAAQLLFSLSLFFSIQAKQEIPDFVPKVRFFSLGSDQVGKYVECARRIRWAAHLDSLHRSQARVLLACPPSYKQANRVCICHPCCI